MFDTRSRRWMVPLLVGALTLAGDQVSKLWIVSTLGPEPYRQALPLIDDWFRLIYAHNTGIAFSLFQGWPQVFIFTSLLISAGTIYIYWKHLPNQDGLVQASIGLIIAGALGNVADRIRLGYVIDFIQLGWWPVFNVADSAICVGAALLALHSLVAERDASAGEQAVAQ